MLAHCPTVVEANGVPEAAINRFVFVPCAQLPLIVATGATASVVDPDEVSLPVVIM